MSSLQTAPASRPKHPQQSPAGRGVLTPRARGTRRRKAIVIALLLVALGPVVDHRMLAPGWAGATYDQAVYFYQLRHYLFEAWSQGRWLPLWNQQYLLGVPFLANIQTAVLFPPNLIFALLPTEVAMGWLTAVHVGLAGAGMFLYGWRGQRLRLSAASVAGIVYMFSSYMTAHLTHLNQANTLAWTPWLMLAADRAAARPRPRAVVPLALAVAMVILAGHTQQAYFSLLLAGGAAAGRLWRPLRQRRWAPLLRSALTALVGVGLGFGLAAAQVLPTLELAGYSIRSGGLSLDDASAFRMTVHEFLGNLLPSYLSERGTESAGSAGAVALALVALALIAGWRRPTVVVLALLVVVAVVTAFGPPGHLYNLLFHLLPGFKLFRVPPRVLIFSTVALALLAGHGAHLAAQLAIAVRRPRWRRRAWSTLAGAAVVASLPVAAVVTDLAFGNPNRSLFKLFPRDESVGLLWPLALFIGAALVVMGLPLAFSQVRIRRLAGAVLPALVLADLLLLLAPTGSQHPLPADVYTYRGAGRNLVQPDLNHRYLSLVRTGYQVPEPAGVGRFSLNTSDHDSYQNYLRMADALQPNVGMGENRLTPDGYDGGILPLKAYVGFRRSLLPPDTTNLIDFTDRDLTDRIWDPRWLELTGTTVVLTSDAAQYDPNPPGCRCLEVAARSGHVIAWRLVDASPSRAWVEDSGRHEARVASDTGETVVVDTNGSSGGHLVLADSFYPGWEAWVDGKQVTIQPYRQHLRQVAVPPGAGQVVFRYQPISVRWGVGMSLGTLLLLAVLGLWAPLTRVLGGIPRTP